MQARNPKYTEFGSVDLEVEHPEYGWIPFTAHPEDVEVLGRELYAQAISGDFGSISPYVAPVISATANKAEAESRLAKTDWVNQPDVYDPAITPHLTNRDEFIAYRAQVRAIAVNPTEGDINWPVEPTAIWSQA